MSEQFENPEEKLAARRSQSRSNEAERSVREPQDHQPKRRKPAVRATELEFNGYIYDVDPDAVDDWELLERASEAGDAGNMMIIKAYLGETYELVKEDLRDKETGRISATDMNDFLLVVRKQLENLK